MPFGIERLSAYRLPRSTIPIDCVALIAFLAMQIGMDPRTLRAFIVLGRFMRLFPIALGVPPQAEECMCEFRRRFGCGERLAKIVHGHVGYSVT